MLIYNYAYDSEGNVVNIADVPKEGHLSLYFTCISCGGQMVAAIGPKRRYFRHKADDTNCNKESYLHKLAKYQIKKKFDDKSIPFEISFWGATECKKHCKRFNERECSSEGAHPYIDLHKYYDTCEEEKGVDGFVADLRLTHSLYPNRKPILIEVFVKHKCTEKKIHSGNKIIEVSVDSEESIYYLKTNKWAERKPFYDSRYNEPYVGVNFYGFEPQVHKTDIPEYMGCSLGRFVLYPSGKFITSHRKCFDAEKRYNKSSIMELNVPWNFWGVSNLEIAHYLKRVHRIELKACSICRHFYQDRYETKHCNLLPNKFMALDKPEFYALECPKFELKWLNQLYKHIEESKRLHDEDVEIIVPYSKNPL